MRINTPVNIAFPVILTSDNIEQLFSKLIKNNYEFMTHSGKKVKLETLYNLLAQQLEYRNYKLRKVGERLIDIERVSELKEIKINPPVTKINNNKELFNIISGNTRKRLFEQVFRNHIAISEPGFMDELMKATYYPEGDIDYVPIIEALNENDFFSFIKISVDTKNLYVTNPRRIKEGKYGPNIIYYAII